MTLISRVSCEYVLPLLLSLTDANVNSSFEQVLIHLGVQDDSRIPLTNLHELPTLIQIAAGLRPTSHRPLAKFVSILFNMLPPLEWQPFRDGLVVCPPSFVAGLITYRVLPPDSVSFLSSDYWPSSAPPTNFIAAMLVDNEDYLIRHWKPGQRIPVWFPANHRIREVPAVVAVAYYGAWQCFSYLMRRCVDPGPRGPLPSTHAAIISNNQDIIRVLAQGGFRFDDRETWRAAIWSHRTTELAHMVKTLPSGLREFCISCGNVQMLKTLKQEIPEQFHVTVYG
jgi:hypothetical protein